MDTRVNELITDIEALQQGREFDLKEFRDRIVQLHMEVPDEQDRVSLICIYLALMNLAERCAIRDGIDPSELDGLKKGEHCYFLIKEASGSDGQIDPTELARVTQREVDAGRMAADDDFHQHALSGAALFGEPDAAADPKPGFFRRLFGG